MNEKSSGAGGDVSLCQLRQVMLALWLASAIAWGLVLSAPLVFSDGPSPWDGAAKGLFMFFAPLIAVGGTGIAVGASIVYWRANRAAG